MDAKEIADRFLRYKTPEPNSFRDISIDELYKQFYIFARQMDALLTDGGEKSLVMTKLEEAMLWAKQSLDVTP